jgi:hypothetical protein
MFQFRAGRQCNSKKVLVEVNLSANWKNNPVILGVPYRYKGNGLDKSM